MKEKAAARIQEQYRVHVEVTRDGEYVVDTVSAGNTAREAEKLAKQFRKDDLVEERRYAQSFE